MEVTENLCVRLNKEILVDPDCKRSEKITAQSAGSAKPEINISLDEPIPPKELPVSNAESAKKNLPKLSMNINASKSPR